EAPESAPEPERRPDDGVEPAPVEAEVTPIDGGERSGPQAAAEEAATADPASGEGELASATAHLDAHAPESAPEEVAEITAPVATEDPALIEVWRPARLNERRGERRPHRGPRKAERHGPRR